MDTHPDSRRDAALLNDTFYRIRWYNTTAWPCTDGKSIMIQYVDNGESRLVEVESSKFVGWLTEQLRRADTPAALYSVRRKMERFLNQKIIRQ